MTKRKMLGWGVCVALAVAVLSFFMDYLSVTSFGITVGMSGFEVLEMAFESMEGGAVMMIIATLATVAALVIAIMGNLKDNVGLLPMVLAVVGVICMFMTFNEDGMMEYAGMGLWLFMLGNLAAVVLSFLAKNAND